jgi:hypothetical protein
MSNSLGKTKTDNWSHCGEKRELETSYHGRMLQRLLALDIHKASRNAPNENHEDGEQENDQK